MGIASAMQLSRVPRRAAQILDSGVPRGYPRAFPDNPIIPE